MIVSLWWRLIRFGFRLLYNEMAWTYDLVSWGVSLGYWRHWQRASIPRLAAGPNDLILELAHGTASLQVDLANAGLRAIGLDLSPAMGRIARRKGTKHGISLRLVRATAAGIPFADNEFHAVVSTFPTEFIVAKDVLREVHRILKPGGRLIVVPNGMLTAGNLLVKFVEWLYQITGQRGPWPGDPLESFRQAGFDAEMIVEQVRNSQVWLIVAERR